ncbi:MAG: alpha/beta hydrolase, partial [Halobacteriota archaeon]
IYVRREGEGKPIVLVHGIALTHDMWRYQVPYLKQNGYEVVSIDLRGFGSSQYYKFGKAAEYTYERWAKDLGLILQAYDLQQVTLVGYSMGGAVAMQYMLDSNWRVDKLVLIAATGPNMQETGLPFPPDDARLAATCVGLNTFAELIKKIDQVGSDQAVKAADDAFEAFLRLTFPTIYLMDFADGIDGVKWLRKMFDSCSREALVGGLKQMHDVKIPLRVGTINTPTRICHGILDPFVPFGLGEHQKKLIADADLTPLIGGHGLFFEQADELNRALAGGQVRQIPECPFYLCPVRWVKCNKG